MPKKKAPDKTTALHRLWQCAYAHYAFVKAKGLVETYLKLGSNERAIAYDSLITAAVVLYARPFKGAGIGTLDDKFKVIGEAQPQIIHDCLIKARDKVIAHNDTPDISTYNLTLRVTKTPYSLGVNITHPKISDETVEHFDKLCAYQIYRIGREMNTIAHILYPKTKMLERLAANNLEVEDIIIPKPV